MRVFLIQEDHTVTGVDRTFDHPGQINDLLDQMKNISTDLMKSLTSSTVNCSGNLFENVMMIAEQGQFDDWNLFYILYFIYNTGSAVT